MIRVDGVSKAFRLYSKPSDRLRELVLRRPFHHHHQALEDISFTLEQGQTLGIIGQNGAGKSTLLKLLTGVLLPDRGRIELSGRITGLLELGTGFNTEMSGLHNIRNNAALLGMTRAEIEDRMEAIIAFAELGSFIGEPMHTYSSGMLMRLGFAVAIHADPTCFVVDEALAVGDAYFQQKCMRAIHAFRDAGGSVLFVSHDMGAVRALCDEVLLLENGRVIDRGSPRAVVDHYHGIILRKTHAGDIPVVIQPDNPNAHPPGPAPTPSAQAAAPPGTPASSSPGASRNPDADPASAGASSNPDADPASAGASRNPDADPASAQCPPTSPPPPRPARSGQALARTGQATLLDVRITDRQGRERLEVIAEHAFAIEVRLRIEQALSEPYYGIGLRDRLGQSAFETNSFFVGGHSEPVPAGAEVCVRWDLDGNLRHGEYGVTVGLANRAEADGRFHETVLFAHEVAILRIARNPDAIIFDGWCNLHPRVQVDTGARASAPPGTPA